MRPLSAVLALLVLSGYVTDGQAHTDQIADNKAKCAQFGFKEGTDPFANCVMKLSTQQQGHQPPDHFTLVNRYKALSIKRRGDSRYPVCSAGDMGNELDVDSGKWVGPNCQMAGD